MTVQYRWPIALYRNTPLETTQGELICIACMEVLEVVKRSHNLP